MTRIPYRRALPWLGLLCVLAAYVIAVVRLHPTNFFGYSNDDMIYFSSAKALADGRGYILPSVPGTPPATKYPVLLPWLLSFAWKWNPSFPANLADAIGIIVAFGCIFLTATFVFVRRLAGFTDGEALLLTGFCALHPLVLFYSSSILSEMPFAALCLLAMLVSDRATRPGASSTGSIAAGILAGVSMLIRILGAPIAVGIFVAAVSRKAWRQAAIFAASAAPFALGIAARAFYSVPPLPPASLGSSGPGWNQTWLYYTNYMAFRRMASPNLHMAGVLALNQVLYLVAAIPGYFLSPLSERSLVLWLVTTPLVLWCVIAGMIRQARISGWQAIHFALLFYVVALLSWDYPDWPRFLIGFLPLFAASLWVEGKYIAGQLREGVRNRLGQSDRVLAIAGVVGMIILVFAMAWNFGTGDRDRIAAIGRERANLTREKREGYEWLQHNSPEQARVIAAEDASLYLYSDRQALGQIAFLPSGAYDAVQLESDLNHMMDVPTAINATYWLASPDDSDKQWKALKPFLAARLAQIESTLPEVYRSSGGRVRIYRLVCSSNQDGAVPVKRLVSFQP